MPWYHSIRPSAILLLTRWVQEQFDEMWLIGYLESEHTEYLKMTVESLTFQSETFEAVIVLEACMMPWR